MKTVILLAFALAACTSNKSSHVAAYLTSDSCHGHVDAATCSTDPGCEWLGLGIACPAGDTSCPSGACVAIDPCASHDEQACVSDTANGCAWADVGELCPAGTDCPIGGGFCYRVDPGGPGGGCACACPLYCPAGADCPPCTCDCGCGDVVSGGTIVSGGGSTGTGSGTPGGAPGPTTTTQDPCSALTDSATCSADATDKCTWYAIGAPCMQGGVCPGGVCQGEMVPPDDGGVGCACACPACAPGETCPPCACDCSGTCGGVTSPPTPAPL